MNLKRVDKIEIQSWKSNLDKVHVTCSACSDSLLALGTSNQGIILLSLSPQENTNRVKFLEENGTLNAKLNVNKTSSPIRSLAINKDSSTIAVGYDNGLISVSLLFSYKLNFLRIS